MFPRPTSNESAFSKSKKLESRGPCFAGDCADGCTTIQRAVASPTPTARIVLFMLKPPAQSDVFAWLATCAARRLRLPDRLAETAEKPVLCLLSPDGHRLLSVRAVRRYASIVSTTSGCAAATLCCSMHAMRAG